MKLWNKLWFILLVVVLLTGCSFEERLAVGTQMAAENMGIDPNQPSATLAPTDTKEPELTLEVSDLPPGEGIGGGGDEDPEDDQGEDEDVNDPGAIGTAIQQTLEAIPTSTAIVVAEEVEVTVVVDNPVTVTPTLTVTPSPTLEISPTPPGLLLTQLANTLTAIVVSSTPTVTPTYPPGFTPMTPTPSITPIGFVASPTTAPCLALRFVADVNVPDGTIIEPGAPFYKTWRVQNIGNCTWAADYSIVYHSGFQLGGTSPLSLGIRIPPTTYVNLTMRLFAPVQAGTYRSNWQLMDNAGNRFGSGSNFDQPFYVEIVVPGSSNNSGAFPIFPGPVSTDPGFTPAP